MMKLLDRYYIVLLRGIPGSAERVPAIITITISAYLLSLGILLNLHVDNVICYGIIILAISVIMGISLFIRYTESRINKIVEVRRVDNRDIRQRDLTCVVFFEIFAVLLFIIAAMSLK